MVELKARKVDLDIFWPLRIHANRIPSDLEIIENFNNLNPVTAQTQLNWGHLDQFELIFVSSLSQAVFRTGTKMIPSTQKINGKSKGQ